jgi:hypothetical protein
MSVFLTVCFTTKKYLDIFLSTISRLRFTKSLEHKSRVLSGAFAALLPHLPSLRGVYGARRVNEDVPRN